MVCAVCFLSLVSAPPWHPFFCLCSMMAPQRRDCYSWKAWWLCNVLQNVVALKKFIKCRGALPDRQDEINELWFGEHLAAESECAAILLSLFVVKLPQFAPIWKKKIFFFLISTRRTLLFVFSNLREEAEVTDTETEAWRTCGPEVPELSCTRQIYSPESSEEADRMRNWLPTTFRMEWEKMCASVGGEKKSGLRICFQGRNSMSTMRGGGDSALCLFVYLYKHLFL